MSRATPEVFEVYEFNECTKFPPTRCPWSRADAMRAVSEGRAKRITHQKIVLAKPEPKERKLSDRRPGRALGQSAAPDGELIERHLLAVNSNQDYTAIMAAQAWAGEVLPAEILRESCRQSEVA